MKRILCVGFEGDKHLGIFNDLIGLYEEVDVCYIQPKYNRGLMGFISRVFLSEKLSNKIPIPSCIKYYLYNISSSDYSDYDIILCVNGALSFPFISKCLNKFKKNGAWLVLYILDCLSSESPILGKTKHLIMSNIWDEVLTFDVNDAQLYGFRYIGLFYYSKINGITTQANPKNDLYFTGGLKGGREKMIEDVFFAGVMNQVNMSFDVMTYSRSDIKLVDGINYRDYWIPYETIVENVCNSNCVLEICQDNQIGPSFRYFEAVCYNKKLLSNNPNIRALPFYNPKWMRVFLSLEEIDWEWVKEIENVQYGYKGDFSPRNLISYLNNH